MIYNVPFERVLQNLITDAQETMERLQRGQTHDANVLGTLGINADVVATYCRELRAGHKDGVR